MKEGLFVILEVFKAAGGPTDEGLYLYYPKNTITERHIEQMWLEPSRVIKASRLRYGQVEVGDVYLDPVDWNWYPATMNWDRIRLILDPEPKEKDEWDEWADSMPHHQIAWREEWIQWLKRMPRVK